MTLHCIFGFSSVFWGKEDLIRFLPLLEIEIPSHGMTAWVSSSLESTYLHPSGNRHLAAGRQVQRDTRD